MGAGGLTFVTAPGGVILPHELHLAFRKLPFSLGYGREAILTLTAENTRRASELAGAAALTADNSLWRLGTKQLGWEVGENISDENVGAVFFIYQKPVVACYAETRNKGGVAFVYGAVVTEGREARLGKALAQCGDNLLPYLANGYMIIKRRRIAREVHALARVIWQKVNYRAPWSEACATADILRGFDTVRVIEDGVIFNIQL